MPHEIVIPFWLAVVLGFFSAWAILDRILVPPVRWFFRRRINQVLEDVNQRLKIRIQPFKLKRRRVLLDNLCYDQEVQQAAEEWGKAEDVPREVVQARVKRIAQEIVPSFNAFFYFRFGYWFARRFAKFLYRVRLINANSDALQEIDPNSTVIFVMNHRSNMDYVLVSYLAAEHSALSYAVGEWARIWPLESLIRSMGAYFVRRKSRDALYRKILARYVAMATEAGVTQAVYPEGGLSRDGRLREPRLGLLDYMLRNFGQSSKRDVLFIPVGLNYDRTLEDRTLLLDVDHDATQRSKNPLITTLSFLGRNVRLMIKSQWHRFGYALVAFGKPISARRFMEKHDFEFHGLGKEQRFKRIGELAEEIMKGIAEVIPVVPVAVVARILLQAETPISKLEIKARALHLLKDLEGKGALVHLPRHNADYTLEVGLRMLVLRHLVREEDGLYHPVESQMSVVAYYSNTLDQFFPEESCYLGGRKSRDDDARD